MREHTNIILRQMLTEAKNQTEAQELLDEARRRVRKGARRRAIMRKLKRVGTGKLIGTSLGAAAALGLAAWGMRAWTRRDRTPYGQRNRGENPVDSDDAAAAPENNGETDLHGSPSDDPLEEPERESNGVATPEDREREEGRWAVRPKGVGGHQQHFDIHRALAHWIKERNTPEGDMLFDALKIVLEISAGTSKRRLDLSKNIKKFRQMSGNELKRFVKNIDEAGRGGIPAMPPSRTRLMYARHTIDDIKNIAAHWLEGNQEAYTPPGWGNKRLKWKVIKIEWAPKFDNGALVIRLEAKDRDATAPSRDKTRKFVAVIPGGSDTVIRSGKLSLSNRFKGSGTGTGYLISQGDSWKAIMVQVTRIVPLRIPLKYSRY